MGVACVPYVGGLVVGVPNVGVAEMLLEGVPNGKLGFPADADALKLKLPREGLIEPKLNPLFA